MATNLRLSDDLTEKLRAESERSGRSQQDLIRRALEAMFAADAAEERPWRVGGRAPRWAYQAPQRRLKLSGGVTTLDLLERDDRL